MALNTRQKAFVQEYLIDLNATQAAIRAGYSKKTAEVQGSRLLSNVKVKSEIDKRLKKREEKALITAEEVINGIKEIAFTDDRRTRNSDRLKAFELLGKHLALFTDKAEHSGDLKIVVKVADEDADA